MTDIISTLGVLILLVVIFVFLGILGWVCELLKYVFEFLWEGLIKGLGCLFWVFIIFCLLIVLLL